MPPKSAIARHSPIAVIALVAVIGAFTLREYISFDTLRDNREALIAFRDNNYLFTVLIFVLSYVLVVAFSLPGSLIATLTGGFLFGTAFGTVFNVSSATLGATLIFLAARFGFVGVPLHRFAISTFLGIIPGGVVYTSVGAGLGEVFARGEAPNLGIIFEPRILFPMLGLCALSLLPIVIKALTGKKEMLK